MTVDDIIRKLNLHVQQNLKIKDPEFWNLLCNHYPQFIEQEIEAHRSILNIKKNKLSKKILKEAGNSWSASQNGMKYFVSLYNDDEDFSFIYCRAKIKAFNIGKLATHLIKTNYPLTLMSHALYEEELICLKYIKELEKPIISNIKKLNYL